MRLVIKNVPVTIGYIRDIFNDNNRFEILQDFG